MSREAELHALATRTAQEFNTVRGEIPSGGGGSASFMQLSNVDIVTDLNISTSVPVVVPLGGTSLSLGSDFTQLSNAIRCNFTGTAKVTANVFMTATTARAAPLMRVHQNGIALGPTFNTSYIRRTGGHDHASCACPSFMVGVTTNDTLDLRSLRDAAANAVLMATVGGSFILVERVA